MALAKWNELDVPALLALEPGGGPGVWRNRFGDSNLNGRSYGGQLLGQAMAAALMEAPADRAPTMMQFLFMQGAMPQEPIDFTVTPLQDGKRFSSRHVRGAQQGRLLLDAQVTCAVPLEAPEHADPTTAPAGEHPHDLPEFAQLDAGLREGIERLGGYSADHKPSVEFRIPHAKRQLSAATATERFRFWMRVRGPLPQDSRLHAAAFAYISDWWLNFSSLSMHLRDIGERRLYISSLNHAMWLHLAPRVDEWLHVETVSPRAVAGRGLAMACFHDLHGRFVASATQECLMAYAG
ncbi:acyl-CoA thioesterase [Caenimonas aquaedulcis]|uniref:Thioesterase family protein n=1 Tax=Caenimonas aquaedulcis TaxID=2793270 RepID=A0A931MHC6_9BURK|nr:acyl-CoA thioesterase domain-containing protein [Caenimonas aquaedulcis]MBG9388070.1 thioesterase family protein [Caenimonas aquaedulcis]